jgi:hypothetical protein
MITSSIGRAMGSGFIRGATFGALEAETQTAVSTGGGKLPGIQGAEMHSDRRTPCCDPAMGIQIQMRRMMARPTLHEVSQAVLQGRFSFGQNVRFTPESGPIAPPVALLSGEWIICP